MLSSNGRPFLKSLALNIQLGYSAVGVALKREFAGDFAIVVRFLRKQDCLLPQHQAPSHLVEQHPALRKGSAAKRGEHARVQGSEVLGDAVEVWPD